MAGSRSALEHIRAHRTPPGTASQLRLSSQQIIERTVYVRRNAAIDVRTAKGMKLLDFGDGIYAMESPEGARHESGRGYQPGDGR